MVEALFFTNIHLQVVEECKDSSTNAMLIILHFQMQAQQGR